MSTDEKTNVLKFTPKRKLSEHKSLEESLSSFRRCTPEEEAHLNEILGLVPQRFNLRKPVYDKLADLAEAEGIIPVAYIRKVLCEHVGHPASEPIQNLVIDIEAINEMIENQEIDK